MRTLKLIVIISMLSLVGAVAAWADSSLPTMLPNCQGVPQAKPSQVVFACGDGNVYAQKLTWTNWGEYYAYAQGVLVRNDCTPNCAAGHFHSYEASLTAYGKQRCPNGELAYKGVSYTITDPKFPSSGDAAYNGVFPCRPM